MGGWKGAGEVVALGDTKSPLYVFGDSYHILTSHIKIITKHSITNLSKMNHRLLYLPICNNIGLVSLIYLGWNFVWWLSALARGT